MRWKKIGILIFVLCTIILMGAECRIKIKPPKETCCINLDGGIPSDCVNGITSPSECAATFLNSEFKVGKNCLEIPECEGKIRCIAKGVELEGQKFNFSVNDGTMVCDPDPEKEIIWKCDGPTGRFVQIKDCSEEEQVCAYGACVEKVDPVKLWFKFDEGNGHRTEDENGKTGYLGTAKDDDAYEPLWATETPLESGYSLDFFNGKYVYTISKPEISEDLVNGFTLEAWIKPKDFSGTQMIIAKPWSYYLYLKGGRLCLKLFLHGSYDAAREKSEIIKKSREKCGFCNPWEKGCTSVPENPYYNPKHETDPSEPECISIPLFEPYHSEELCSLSTFSIWDKDKWIHVAATYNAPKRTMQLYRFKPGHEYTLNKPIATKVLNCVETMHNGDASLEVTNHHLFVGGLYNKHNFNGLIDEVKIYDYAKTCFDPYNEGKCEGKCSFLPTETLYTYYGHLSDVAPGYDYCNLDDPTLEQSRKINRMWKLNTSDSDCLLNPWMFKCWTKLENVQDMCVGDTLKMVFIETGKFTVEKEIKGSIDCDLSCFEECNERCIDYRLSDCIMACKKFCTNWVCPFDNYETYCGGENGQNVTICTILCPHGPCYKECVNVTLAPDETTTICKEECATQCNIKQNVGTTLLNI